MHLLRTVGGGGAWRGSCGALKHALRGWPFSTAHPDEDADEDEHQDQHDGGDHAADAGVGHWFLRGAWGGGHVLPD